MLRFLNIHKKFKTDFWKPEKEVLKGISFEIKAQKIIGFLGENGAGKTTLIKILLGFIKENSGEIYYHDKLLKNRSELLKNIGYMPERPYFYPNLTGRQFLHYLGEIQHVPKKLLDSRIKEWSLKLNIYEALERKIASYSKGMLQRLGMVSVVLHDPQLIVLDEPLSGLDPIGRKELKDVLLSLNSHGKTVFFSSHIVPDVEQICDQVVFIKEGLVKYTGQIDSLIEDNVRPNYSVTIRYDKNEAPSLSSQVIKQKSFEEEGVLTLFVHFEKKNQLLRELVDKNYEIIKLERERLGLEEIFYSAK